MSSPRITFGIIVLNGEPFIRYNLRALYPFAHQIIVVEGACPAAAGVATPEGHSRDGTLQTLRRFQAEEDPQHKLVIVTAEDEGRPNGFWEEKGEMSQAYAKRATGNYLWQTDSDEFYLPAQMEQIIAMLRADPSITVVAFEFLTFWGGLKYITSSYYLETGIKEIYRLFAWGPGYSYVNHRPPTVADADGRDLRTRGRVLKGAEMQHKGIRMYHYEMLFPKQVADKCAYYAKVGWSEELRQVESWRRDTFDGLARPYRVHMVYSCLSWLMRFDGPQPPEVVAMVDAVARGEYPGISLRRTDDTEQLLASRSYCLGRGVLRAVTPLVRVRWQLRRALGRCLRRFIPRRVAIG